MMIDDNPIDADLQLGDDDIIDRSLRPEYLQDFVGQPKLKEQLSIFKRGFDDIELIVVVQRVSHLSWTEVKMIHNIEQHVQRRPQLWKQ